MVATGADLGGEKGGGGEGIERSGYLLQNLQHWMLLSSSAKYLLHN